MSHSLSRVVAALLRAPATFSISAASRFVSRSHSTFLNPTTCLPIPLAPIPSLTPVLVVGQARREFATSCRLAARASPFPTSFTFLARRLSSQTGSGASAEGARGKFTGWLRAVLLGFGVGAAGAAAYWVWSDSSKVSFIQKWRLRQAGQAAATGQYEAAEQQYKAVLAELPPQSEAYAHVRDLMANLYFESKQWELARVAFTEVMQALLKSGRQQNDDAVVEISIKTAECFRRLGRVRESEIGARWAVKTMTEKISMLGDSSLTPEEKQNQFALLGVALDGLAQTYEHQGEYMKALEPRGEAVRVAAALGAEMAAMSLNRLAQTYLDLDKLEEAEQSLAAAARALDSLPSRPADAYIIFINYASVLVRRGKKTEAARVLEETRAKFSGHAEAQASIADHVREWKLGATQDGTQGTNQ